MPSPEKSLEDLDLSKEQLEGIIEEINSDIETEDNIYKLKVKEMESEVGSIDFHSTGELVELVSGEENILTVKLENIGENHFPGGVMSNIELRIGISGGVSFTKEVEIPPIEAGEVKHIELAVNVFHNGQLGLHADVEPVDEGSIEIKSTNSNEINEPFRAIPREQIEIVSHLEDINKKLS